MNRTIQSSVAILVLVGCVAASCLAADDMPSKPPTRSRAEVQAVLSKAPKPEGPLRPLNIVLVAGPKDHGPAQHDYPQWQRDWQPLLSKLPNVTVTTAWKWPSKEQLASANLLVCYFKSPWTAEQVNDVKALHARGGGFVTIHWAIAPDTDQSFDLHQQITGLDYHSAGYRHGALDVKFHNTTHPLLLGFPPTLHLADESYFPTLGDRSKVTLLGTSDEHLTKDDPALTPVPRVWTYEPPRGKGRTFVSIPGHFMWSFDDPLFRLLLLRGMAWSAGESPYRFDQIATQGVTFAEDNQTERQPSAPPAFPIGYWCGPPAKFTTLERYREIKDAGFTFAMPPCDAITPALNHKILDACGQVGLKALIADPRIPLNLATPQDKARLDAVVAEYKDHPALWGYFLTDEPAAPAFGGLAKVVAYLRLHDPAHVAYVNFLPNYATPAQLGTPTYDAYVEAALAEVKPFAFSYDHYHLLKGSDRPGFYENLDSVRRIAAQHTTPFWQIVMSTQHLAYRNPTEAELRFTAMQTLAYGGQGLLYFTYWAPPSGPEAWTHAVINADGTRDAHYDMVKRVNADLQSIGSQLLDAELRNVWKAGPTQSDKTPDKSPLKIHSTTGDVTVSIFRTEKSNLALLASRDYRNAIDVGVKTSAKNVQQLNPADSTWQPAAQTHHLPPAGAILLRW